MIKVDLNLIKKENKKELLNLWIEVYCENVFVIFAICMFLLFFLFFA